MYQVNHKKRKRISAPVTGGISLLVIFAVLVLTVFAVLSISTVMADNRLSDKMSDSVKGYYQADCQAEEILALIRSGEIPEGVEKDGDIYTYSCEVSEVQNLDVKVRVSDVGQGLNAEYEIVRWQLVASADWENDETLPVWDGEMEEQWLH